MKRLELRGWTRSEEDLSRAARLWSDEEVTRFLGGPYSPEEVRARVEREIANGERYGIQYWQVLTLPEREFAGCCGLKPVPGSHDAFELGFQLLPAYWGRGLAGEAARSVIAFAFDELGASALYAGRHPENTRSAALLDRLGFVQIGTHFFERTGLDHPWYELRP